MVFPQPTSAELIRLVELIAVFLGLRHKIQDIHLTLNSRLDEWKKEFKAESEKKILAAHAQGRLDERKYNKERRRRKR